jgi:hypothetical protein
MNDFLAGLKQGFRPFRPAYQRAVKGLLIFAARFTTGLLALLLGAETLAGGLIAFNHRGIGLFHSRLVGRHPMRHRTERDVCA